MAMTNHERVGKALDLLRDGLRPFLERELKSQYQQRWFEEVKTALSPQQLSFAGTADELEALVQFLNWSASQRPQQWTTSEDPRTMAQIQKWLEEAGTDPGDFERHHERGSNSEW